ncbi:MAG TPA: adenylate/guanylate cyclase domain-containing protein, partial [Candidatus Ozemobacteraceae bacterium]|nr:adenylate/guanylate cyclase domain-containing protein [Candidatus Ozemobacteraceae bacterium]
RVYATIDTDRSVICAIRSLSQNAHVLVFEYQPPHSTAPFLTPGVISALSITFLLLLLAWARAFTLMPSWNIPLQAKFRRIIFVILLFPFGGMLFMYANTEQQKRESHLSQVESTLEERLESVETRAELSVYQRLFDITKGINSYDWRVRPSQKEMTELFNRHEAQGLEELFVLHHSSPHLLSQKAQTAGRHGHIRRMVSLIFRQFQDYTGLYVNQDSTPSNSADELQSRFLMEGMQDLFGGESLYQLALHQNHLLSFSLFEEMTWICIQTLRDSSHRPLAGFLLTLSRKDLQRQILGEMVLDATSFHSLPSLTFAHTLERSGLHFMPEAAASHPDLHHLLTLVARTGITHRATIQAQGRTYLALARRLRFFDYAAVAIEPLPEVSAFSGNTVLFLFLSAIPLLGFLLGNLRFRHRYLEPILQTEQAVHELTHGNFSVSFPSEAHDEIGELGRAFTNMSASLKEKEFLQRFLSDFTMDLVRNPTQIKASRLQATILFADIRGFTTLSESCPPEELVDTLNEYFSRMEAVIEAHGGSIDKFIGDAIMAVFLPRLDAEPSAVRAAKAGLEMQREVSSLSEARQALNRFPIRIGVGLATGEVLLGLIGSDSGRRDFAVTGPPVSLAATMEKRSKDGISSRVVV